MIRTHSALAAALAVLASSTLTTPAFAGDAISKAALAACRAAAHEHPAEFDGLVRVTTCQRVTALRLRQRIAEARAASVLTARIEARGPAQMTPAARR
jgi:hypothetical protein